MIWRIVSLIFACIAGGTLGLWCADRESPTEFISAVVLNPTAPPGGELSIRWTVDRRRSCASSADRILVDSKGRRFVLNDLEFKGAPGPLGPESYVSTINIPLGMTPGEAEYRFVVAYYCNPLHRLWPIVPPPVVITFNVK